MCKLIIDTSSEYCLLILAKQSSVLAHHFFLHENKLSCSLLPAISTLMQHSELTLKNLDSIAVGVGPGSYTGTRVGVTVAKSLAYGLNISVRGFCSLAAFLPNQEGEFISLLPAKSGNFYLLKGRRNHSSIQIEHADLASLEKTGALLSTVDFVTARRKEDIPKEYGVNRFIAFDLAPQNSIDALQDPPHFSFEKEVKLIYLH